MSQRNSRNSSFAATCSPCTATTLLRSRPRLSVEDPKVYMVDHMATSISEHLAGCQTRPAPLSPILEPGVLEGSGPAACPGHLHSPSSPCRVLGLLPPPIHPQRHPFPEPLRAASAPLTSLPPGLRLVWALSPPPTPRHILMGRFSFWGRRVAGRQNCALSVSTTFLQPVTWLWSCFHGNRA